MKNPILSLVGSLILAYSAALIGSLFTVGAISEWYSTLLKPALSPPNWLFAPVWTILYALMAIAAWLIWERRHHTFASKALFVYGAQLVFNALWSVVFFGLHNPALGLFVIALLWTSIATTAVQFYKINRLAGYLFIPYIAWVSFAAYLNFSIVLLN